MKTFKTFKEYEKYYTKFYAKPKPPKNKYYQLGEQAASDAIKRTQQKEETIW